VVALQPGRLIDQDGKSSGVALGERVAAKAWSWPKTISATARGTPLACAPARKAARKRSISSRAAFAAQRPAELLALPPVKPARSRATFKTCSWNK